jgi:hypothetical protein
LVRRGLPRGDRFIGGISRRAGGGGSDRAFEDSAFCSSTGGGVGRVGTSTSTTAGTLSEGGGASVRGNGGANGATRILGRGGATGGGIGNGSGRGGAFVAGGADFGGGPPSRPGTMKSWLHFWHRTCLPAISSGKRSTERQPVQNVEMAIAEVLLGPIGRELAGRYPL